MIKCRASSDWATALKSRGAREVVDDEILGESVRTRGCCGVQGYHQVRDDVNVRLRVVRISSVSSVPDVVGDQRSLRRIWWWWLRLRTPLIFRNRPLLLRHAYVAAQDVHHHNVRLISTAFTAVVMSGMMRRRRQDAATPIRRRAGANAQRQRREREQHQQPRCRADDR